MARIAYRRLSGAVGLMDAEKGTRGLWWEKRRDLIKFLVNRGHKVEITNRMTTHSSELGSQWEGVYDVMIVEFGSANINFYGEDIDETFKMIQRHRGEFIFLCDDPDLPMMWDRVQNMETKRWTCWYNAKDPVPFGKHPAGIRVLDMPFSSLSDHRETVKDPTGYQKNNLVYIGRSLGRKKMFEQIFAGKIPLKIYGKQKEWDSWGVRAHAPPEQPLRSHFYSQQLGCLAIADTKHKLLKWRTGRAFHAIKAGCPAVFEPDHKAFEEYKFFKSMQHLNQIVYNWANEPDSRFVDLNRQQMLIKKDLEIAKDTAKMTGL